MRRCCIGMLCSLATVQLAGQVVTDTIGDTTHAIDEVQVTGRRMPRRLSAAVPVQVIGSEELKSRGLQGVADAVRRMAGTTVRDYGGIGGLKTVSVRNLGVQHTAVSYDGITLSNTQAGQIDIGRFSLDNVAYLSLAIGQAEDLLQTARHYASAGVLTIETERPRFEAGRRHAGRVMLKGGSFGSVSPSLRWWQRAGERTTLSAEATFQRADGIYPFSLTNGSSVTRERRHNSDITSWQGEANLYHTLKGGGEWTAKAYYYYSERGLPGSVILYNAITEERLWDENFFAQTTLRKPLSEAWQLRASAKYNHSWNRYEDTDVKYDGGRQTDVHRQDEYYLSATLLWKPLPRLTLSLAQDGVANALRTNVNDSPNPLRFTSLTALNANLKSGPLDLTAHLTATYVTDDVKAGSAPDDRKHLSPSLSLAWHPCPSLPLYLRAMYKSTFRVPTFNDLYYRRMGNVNLRPEKAGEYNLGLTWSLPPTDLLDNLTLTLDGYYNRVTDKIVAFPSTYIWRMANFGKVDIWGLDATMAATIPLGKAWSLGLSGNYSYQKATDKTDPTAKNYNTQLPYTPLHSGNAALTLETPWLRLGYSVTAVGRRYSAAGEEQEYLMRAYDEHTLTLSREFSLTGTCRLRLQADLVNLTDEQYDIIKYYPMPGRSWRLAGSITF